MTDHLSRAARAAVGALALLLSSCATQVPQAYRGRMFATTGLFALYQGRTGFTGQVLDPGTYYTGVYGDVRLVECATVTTREPLTALTRDGVQFGLDLYVRFSANCTDEGVEKLFARVLPNKDGIVTAASLYDVFVKPAVGSAVRQVVSPYRANDINEKREEVLEHIRASFVDTVSAREHDVLSVYEVNLSNLDFPDAMDAANVDRAVQGVLKDKAVAERERVQAEIETALLRRQLAEREGDVTAVRVRRVGAALREYPEFLQYDLQTMMPEIYRHAGANGNLVIAAPNPVTVTPRGPSSAPAPRASGAPPTPPRTAP